jgi:hypothetical protein
LSVSTFLIIQPRGCCGIVRKEDSVRVRGETGT